jgi:DNA-binding MarR family transcriptional regulator
VDTVIDLGWTLGTIKRAYLEAAAGVVADVPGGPRGYLVLVTTGRGEPRSQLALAQHLGVDRTAMTYLIDDLERAGLVERKPDPTDRRARRVAITNRGRSLLHEVQGGLHRAEDELLAPLEEQERTTLRTLLQRLATAIAPADPCRILDTIVEVDACPTAGRRAR